MCVCGSPYCRTCGDRFPWQNPTPKETPVSETYPAGAVAVATVRGKEDVRVMRCISAPSLWLTDVLLGGTRLHGDKYVTDIRPLVVLDPDDWGQVGELVQRAQICTPGTIITGTVTQFRDALRSMIAPPKPAEPLGLGAVVATELMQIDEDDDDETATVLIRHSDGLWWAAGGRGGWEWRDVPAVRVLSVGVPS